MTAGVGEAFIERNEAADGMRIDWDVPVPISDGVALRADVFRPDRDGEYPVLMTLGPYGKGLAFQEGYAGMWQRLATAYPDAVAGSSNRYQVWETVDPQKWVPDGRDFQMPGDGPWPVVYGIEQRGNGVFVHDDPDDRPTGIFDGTTTLHTGPDSGTSLLLPVIPARS